MAGAWYLLPATTKNETPMIAAPYGNQQTLWILSGFVLICLIVGITYSNAFKAVWIYDDFPTIVNNENIRMENLTGQEIRKSFNGRRNSDKNKFSRPLSYLTFALNYYFNGYEIFGYHFVNIIIHMINACLVLVLMVKDRKSVV